MADSQSGDGPVVHVLTRKEELDSSRLADKIVVVVDILFATTSIIVALDRGVPVVYPARDADEARHLARRAGLSNPVMSGESMFRFIEGFVSPTPLALADHLPGHDALVYATTNGTVALRACAAARRVLVGALINATATVDAIAAGDDSTVIIMCAGTAGAFNLEDFYGAGCLVDRLSRARPARRLTDAALAARDCFRASDAVSALQRSLVGRLMHEWQLDDEVAFAAGIDHCGPAAELNDGRVEPVRN